MEIHDYILLKKPEEREKKIKDDKGKWHYLCKCKICGGIYYAGYMHSFLCSYECEKERARRTRLKKVSRLQIYKFLSDNLGFSKEDLLIYFPYTPKTRLTQFYNEFMKIKNKIIEYLEKEVIEDGND